MRAFMLAIMTRLDPNLRVSQVEAIASQEGLRANHDDPVDGVVVEADQW